MNYSQIYSSVFGPLGKLLKIDNTNIKSLVKDYIRNPDESYPFPFNTVKKYKPISEWDVSQVTNMSELFQGYVDFNEDIGKWNVSNVTNMEYMFQGCTKFNQQLNWDVSKVTKMNDMFSGCSDFNKPLKSEDGVGDWNVSNVYDMNSIFRNCIVFDQELNWNVSNVKYMIAVFNGCTNFNQELNWNVEDVKVIREMFKDCKTFNQALHWNVSKVTIMASTFEGCTNFDQPLDWDVANVTNMEYMFKDCIKFNQVLQWNVNKVQNMRRMFQNCKALTQTPTPNWIFGSRTDIRDMFKDCCDTLANRDQLNSYQLMDTESEYSDSGSGSDFDSDSGSDFDSDFDSDDEFEVVNYDPDEEKYSREVHEAAAKVKFKELNDFLSEKSGNIKVPENIDYPYYITRKLTELINTIEVDDDDYNYYESSNIKNNLEENSVGNKRKLNDDDGDINNLRSNRRVNLNANLRADLRGKLTQIMNKLNEIKFEEFNIDLRESIFYCLSYVERQPAKFRDMYVKTLLKDCIIAYRNELSCSGGILERFALSFLMACLVEPENPDYKKIISLLQTPIDDYILDWYKLHKNGESLPDEEDITGREENLRQYLLNQELLKGLPGHEEMINEAIKKYADVIGYKNDDFTYGGGKRKTRKIRKAIKFRKSCKKTIKVRRSSKKTIKARKSSKKTIKARRKSSKKTIKARKSSKKTRRRGSRRRTRR